MTSGEAGGGVEGVVGRRQRRFLIGWRGFGGGKAAGWCRRRARGGAGRAGEKGEGLTFFDQESENFAGAFVADLDESRSSGLDRDGEEPVSIGKIQEFPACTIEEGT